MRLQCRILATTGHYLAPMSLCRSFKEAMAHLPLSTHLAAPAYCRMVVFISDPLSTVALVELRRSLPRNRMASLVLTAIR